MWGESSKKCENNCQCAGLITENFKINSGNNATKRKHEEAASQNYRIKMRPHSLDFNKQSPVTPTFEKRRILGEIQNSQLRSSPVIERLKNTPLKEKSLNQISPSRNISPFTHSLLPQKFSPLSHKISPLPQKISPLSRSNSPITQRIPLSSVSPYTYNSPLHSSLKSLSERKVKHTKKISRIFEERSRFKMSNKENVPMMSDSFLKLDMEEDARDCSFGANFEASCRETKIANSSITKLDFTDALQSKFAMDETMKDLYVQEKQEILDSDLETSLHDLEEEFNAPMFDDSHKYEIFSTDSPNIISQGRSTSRKYTGKDFIFGAPIEDNEKSTSFNKNATRMLNFEEDFEFPSPATKRITISAKKSLKFTETPPKNTLKHEKSDSSIGSMVSPCSSKRFPSESLSMESGFVSEFEEPFLEMEEISNSPKMPNFNDLLSGQIKEDFTEKLKVRRPMHRSLSFNPESSQVRVNLASKARVNLFSIKESPEKKKRCEEGEVLFGSKRRKANKSPERKRPVLQRSYSENNASIMSALARSMGEPDLIGDFSLPFALPLTTGDHCDLKSICCDTLAGLLRGEYQDSIRDFKVIDCRYPYEFAGGHIAGAVNLYTPEQIQALVSHPLPAAPGDGRRSILVFHCEFSLERGPKLYRLLRSSDRAKNREAYPALHYPELYLLHGGYRRFYLRHAPLCEPTGYTAMLDPGHRHLLKQHRSQ